MSMKFDEYLVESVLVTALEGGIGYWTQLLTNYEEWSSRDESTPKSEFAVSLILNGGSLYFNEIEENKVLELSLDSLEKACKETMQKTGWDGDEFTVDVEVADCIIQYSLLGDLVYG